MLKHQTSDGYSDLYIPFFLRLPFWIERGLILLNANIPSLKSFDNKNFRVYEEVNNKILEVIENKLGQKIIEL